VTRFARIAALLAGSAALVFVLLGPWLLMLFGPAYREAGPALAVLGLGFVCACLFGPSLLVVTLAGRSRLTTAALLSGVVVNATLVAWLAPLWGATGAALGAAIGTVLPPMLCWWWLRRTLGLDAAVWARGPAVQQVQ
jgi:O-antigen/teichoic acid export membrane protein